MLKLSQELRLQQKLSPQQIQYIQLLQLPTLALEQRIQQELERNPLLEEAGNDLGSDTEEHASDSTSDEEFDLEDLLPDVDNLYGYKAHVDNNQEDREISVTSTESMTDYLRGQKGFLDLNRRDTLIAEQIIGSIDEDGYLRRAIVSIVDDISFNYREDLNEQDVLNVLHIIQRLDPPGIAARNVQECLLIQLNVRADDTHGLSVARDVISREFDAFSKRQYGRIKHRLGIDDHTLKSAIDLIQSCNPKPGEGTVSAQENYVIPDFLVKKVEDSFVIQLNSGNFPSLVVSKSYRKMIQQMSSKKKSNSISDSETSKFLRSKLESAKWFIDAVQQRRQTMLSVMHEIVSSQEEFFNSGEGHLRPLILKDIATQINLDISTVSRVVSGKYVQCDYGVYELKYFFSEGVATDEGDTVSNKEVKSIIAQMIEGEDKTNPLTDHAITTFLKERGYRIARRTVSKYRLQLGLPVARLRREIVISEDQ